MKYLSDWSEEWPTEPGLYLFYGDYGNPTKETYKARFKLVSARMAGQEPKRFLVLVGDGAFIYQSEQTGIFRKIEIEKPEWPNKYV